MWNRYCLLLMTLYLQKKMCFRNNTLYKSKELNKNVHGDNLPTVFNPTQLSTPANNTTALSDNSMKRHYSVKNSSQLLGRKSLNFNSWNIIEIALYAIIFLIGVIGNAMLITSIIKDVKLHNLQNYFILNLAFADLVTLTVIMPMYICMQYTPWPFGTFICHCLVPFYDCIPAVSIFTVVVVSCDRYRIIIYALPKSLPNGLGVFIIIFIWILSYAIVGLPLKFVMKLKNGTCYAYWANNKYIHLYYISRLVILYILPTFLIFFVWFRVRKILQMNILKLKHAISKDSQIKWINHQRKIVTVFLVIFIVFFVCYLPFQLITLFSVYWKGFNNWDSRKEILSLSVILAFMNAITNPVILYTLSTTFRRHFQHFLPILCKLKNRGRSESLYSEADFEEFKERRMSFYQKLLRRRSTTQTLMLEDSNQNLQGSTGRRRNTRSSVGGAAILIKTIDDSRKRKYNYIKNDHTVDSRDALHTSQV